MAHDIIFTTHSQVQTNDINNKEIIEIDDDAQKPDQKSRFRPGILESVICITYVLAKYYCNNYCNNNNNYYNNDSNS